MFGLVGCDESTSQTDEVEHEPVFQSMFLTHDFDDGIDLYHGDVIKGMTLSQSFINDYREVLLVDLPFDDTVYDFYTNQDEAVLNIVIDNPEDLPITRFTLNGVNYFIGDYQQRTEGLIQMSVSIDLDEPVNTFSLDELLYLDQRSVQIAGDQVIKAAVTRDEIPVVLEAGVSEHHLNHVLIDYEIEDGSLFDMNEALLRVAVIEENELLFFEDLTLDDESMMIDNLLAQRTYELVFILMYDMWDGDGVRIDVINHESLKMDALIEITEVEAGFNSVSFDVGVDALTDLGEIREYLIYHGDELVQTHESLDELLIKDLLANQAYDLVIEYAYERAGDVYLDAVAVSFTTTEARVPSMSLDVITQTHHTLDIQPVLEDEDGVGEFIRMEVYVDGLMVERLETINESVLLEDLYANQSVHLIAVYQYDLFDGEGFIQQEKSMSVKTHAYQAPALEVLEETIDYHVIELEALFRDSDQIGRVEAVRLYQDDTIIEEVEFSSRIMFDKDLLSNTGYLVSFEIVYDLLDGRGEQISLIEFEFETLTYDVPEIELLDVGATYHGATFELLLKDNYGLAETPNIYLYQDETRLDELDFKGEFSFDELYANKAYTLVIEYTYDLHDGEGTQLNRFTYEFKTEAYETPQLMVKETDVFYHEALVDIDVIDQYQLAHVETVELYLNDELIETILFNDGRLNFDDLLSDTEYTLKISVTYDLLDNQGEQSFVFETEFKTQAYQPAHLLEHYKDIQIDAIHLEAWFGDWGSLLETVEIKVYADESLVHESVMSHEDGALEVIIDDLEPDQHYRIIIKASYDLMDGDGVHDLEYEFEAHTKPNVELIDVSLDKTLVEYGDELTFTFTFDTSSDLVVTHIGLLGPLVEVTHLENQTYELTMMITEDRLEPGQQRIMFEDFQILWQDQALVYETFIFSPEINVFIAPEYQGLNATNLDYESIHFIKSNQDFYIEVHFDNPSMIEIDRLYLKMNYYNDTWFEKDDIHMSHDRQTAYIKVTAAPYGNNMRGHNIRVLAYESAGEETILHEPHIIVPIVTQDDVVEVSTPEDLQSMTEPVLYRLTNDIDLTGFDWTPYIFVGALDGNGYSIKNLTIDQTTGVANSGNTHVMGMFTRIRGGSVYHLTLKDSVVNVVLENPYSNESIWFNVGVLAGWLQDESKIYNVQIKNAKLTTAHNMNGSSHIGGMIGQVISDSTMEKVSAVIEITHTIETQEDSIHIVGGLIGQVIPRHRFYLNQAYVNGDIESLNRGSVGGLIGNVHRSDIYNVSTNVQLKAIADSFGKGGVTGYMTESSVTNGYATGSININGDYFNNVGGFTDNNQQSYLYNIFSTTVDINGDTIPTTRDSREPHRYLTHVYDIEVNGYGTRATLSETLDIMQALWDQDIWDFSNVSEGGLPRLRFI